MKRLVVSMLFLCSCAERKGTVPFPALNREPLQAQGISVTTNFLATYPGRFVDAKFGESVTIGSDGSIAIQSMRQVGSDDNKEVPYPTVCSYVQTGHVQEIIERYESDRERYLSYATHIFVLSISKVEINNILHTNTMSNVHCHHFVKQQMAALHPDSPPHRIYGDLLDHDSFRLHTSGGGDTVDGQPRTESTLDEVYVRVPASAPAPAPAQ